MKRILIVSIGDVDPDILRNVANALEKAFHCKIELGKKMLIPGDSYNLRESSTTLQPFSKRYSLTR